MPLYMDRHDLDGATADDISQAHAHDLAVQSRHGVRYLSYWFDYRRQHAFCLVEAPTAGAAEAVHREAHGNLASSIIEVDPARVHEFLGVPPQEPPGRPYEATAFRTILFTDIVGSTALTQRLGDEGAMAVLRRHNQVVREGLDRFGGREIKHTGDGIMASLMSASKGVECAVWIQRRLAELGEEAGGLVMRIGVSAGEPVADGDDLFGTAVQLAARLCDHAGPGGILVSVAVRELCAGKMITFSERVELEMRGFEQPVGAYRVAWSPQAGA